ncbi:MAG: hypothetical protein JST06_10360 [Bacteroidetes bacterium]|nr:hypothetical protein [Bacteroidota bacterium]MBS1630129.1 hypothetical protein [Bacteroidota bacterium]
MHFTQKAWLLCLFALCLAGPAFAKKEKKASDEQGIIHRLMGCLSHRDPYCYTDLWPDLDTLSALVMKYSELGSRDYRRAASLQRQPLKVMHADSVFQAYLRENFDSVIASGSRLGIHWDGIVLTRYELIRQHETRDSLYEKLAPVRFVGYLFFMDIATGRNYGILVGNILKINGGWWGGELGAVYPATSRDEWRAAQKADLKEKRERKNHPVVQVAPPGEVVPSEDSSNDAHTESDMDAGTKPVTTNVVSRLFYSGMFDNEIPVQLYVRGLAGSCPDQLCGWEAIYKFGDQDDFVLLDVSKTKEGKWQFIEEPPAATMELSLKDKTYTGSWISAEDQTGYDVKLTEITASAKKIVHLDKIFAELKTARKQ